jgi:hypothetical protein
VILDVQELRRSCTRDASAATVATLLGRLVRRLEPRWLMVELRPWLVPGEEARAFELLHLLSVEGAERPAARKFAVEFFDRVLFAELDGFEGFPDWLIERATTMNLFAEHALQMRPRPTGPKQSRSLKGFFSGRSGGGRSDEDTGLPEERR